VIILNILAVETQWLRLKTSYI